MAFITFSGYAHHMVHFVALFLTLTSSSASVVMPLNDNVLFAFEKCKTLSVNLEKGQLVEAVVPSFDLHCRKNRTNPLEFLCDYFETGSSTHLKQEKFFGGSFLGKVDLSDSSGKKIQLLVGKNFASYQSGPDQKVCAGIFIFEQDALKRKSSSLKSGL